MTEELKALPIPYEKEAREYADKQSKLYRELKDDCGGYAHIVDAFIAGTILVSTEKDKEIEKLKLNIQEDSVMFQKEIKELKAQIEKSKAVHTNGMVK